MSARSTHSGSHGTTRNAAGSAASTTITAIACSSSRGQMPSGRMSSMAPTPASATAPARMTAMRSGSSKPPGVNTNTPAATTIVAATTAMPPPCGVGARCEERAFGRASA